MSEVVLIDLASVLHPIWHLETANPDPNATSIKTVERVRALASGQPMVGVCVDMPPYDRKAVEPTYKAHRETNAPLQHQMRLAIDTLRGDGFPIFGVQGLEADDILACLSARVMAATTFSVLLVTADKDAACLVSDRVRIKSLKDGSILDTAAVEAKFGVPPALMVDWLCLVGDASDGIKGADKVGPKTATGLLKEFGSLDAIFAAFDKGITPTLTPNLRSRLQEFRARADVVRSLVRLRTDAPIDIAPLLQPRVATNDSAVIFDDDPTTFIGFGHADTDLAAAHADAAHAGAAPVPDAGADVQAAPSQAATVTIPAGPAGVLTFPPPSQEAIDDLRDVFAERNGDQVNRRTGEEVLKRAYADAIAGITPIPVVTAPNGDTVNAITGEVLYTAASLRAAQNEQPAPASAGAFADRAASAGEHTGPAVAAPAKSFEQAVASLPMESKVNRTYQGEPHVEREAIAENRPAGRPMVRDDALQGEQGRGPGDAAGSRIPDGTGGARRDGPDRGDREGRAPVEVLPAVSYERQLEPRSLGEAYKLSEAVMAARNFSQYGSAQEVLTIVLRGRELGIGAMTSLASFHKIDGKPSPSADLIQALVMRSGAVKFFYCKERTKTHATYVAQRKEDPEPTSLTYSVTDAKAAWTKSEDAWKKSAWTTRPEDMCVARAKSKLARIIAPEATMGMYCPEELE